MKLQNIFENEASEVHTTDRFSFRIGFNGEKKISLKNFIRDKVGVSTLHVQDGDFLSFDYQPESRGINKTHVTYELRMHNTQTNEKRFLEDAEFDLRSEDDVERFKTEIHQKLESFKTFLPAEEIRKIMEIYKELLQQ